MQHISQYAENVKSLTASNDANTLTNSQKQQNRQQWFTTLLLKLNAARNIRIDSERAGILLAILHEQNYGEYQARIAEQWILFGNWVYKGANPTLELADFYPTDDQQQFAVERLRAEGYIVMTPEQLKRHTDAARYQERVSVEQRFTGFVPPEIKKVVDEVTKPENFDRSFDELGLA